MVALVVTEFITLLDVAKKFVLVRLVAIKFIKFKVVKNALVDVRLVTDKLVPVPFVKFKLVVVALTNRVLVTNKFVLVKFVNTGLSKKADQIGSVSAVITVAIFHLKFGSEEETTSALPTSVEVAESKLVQPWLALQTTAPAWSGINIRARNAAIAKPIKYFFISSNCTVWLLRLLRLRSDHA